GPSGCGKTSLLVSMFGLLDRPGWHGTGAVRLRGRQLLGVAEDDLQELRRTQLAFLMQDAHGALDPLVRVGEQIEAATGRGRDDVVDMLQRLGIADAASLCERQPHRISGGQAQRALLAIAFLRRPPLVVADEPSASLDGGSYAELVGRLRELVAAGSALLMATHDHRLLRDLDAEVYAIEGGTFARAQPQQAPWPARPPEDVGTVAVLEADGISVSYGSRAVLDGVDLRLRRGEIVALLGESGAGKTTLMRVLAGHREPDRGRVVRPPRRAAVQLVCQDALASLTPRRSLRGMLDEAHAPFFDAGAGASAVRLPEAVLDRTAAAMSGGERRRAALLRAIAVQPDVLLLDEPTASLDREAAATVVENLLTMQRSRALALLIATHDESLAEAIAHRRLILREGRLCEL
ncbi:MAG: ABC transporter ATP-binding protein, partial [Planctomycetes bacterium]|nr:ABC transporter ATP-binding protein [Planctomycetota bacterium]